MAVDMQQSFTYISLRKAGLLPVPEPNQRLLTRRVTYVYIVFNFVHIEFLLVPHLHSNTVKTIELENHSTTTLERNRNN